MNPIRQVRMPNRIANMRSNFILGCVMAIIVALITVCRHFDRFFISDASFARVMVFDSIAYCG